MRAMMSRESYAVITPCAESHPDPFDRGLRGFLHYFTFLNATPAQSDLDYWKNYLATLDDQMRDDLLADPAFASGG